MTTPTPRTDALMNNVYEKGLPIGRTYRSILAEHARQLERELAEARNEIARLRGQTKWECKCGGTDCEGQKENEEQARLLDMSATREAKLRADLDAMMRDLRSLLSLLAEIREATGDNGRRMQDDLVAHCADLAKRAAVLEKVRAYPYTPSGLAAMIERELANPDLISSPSARERRNTQ